MDWYINNWQIDTAEHEGCTKLRSKEEAYFFYYLRELYDNGYIEYAEYEPFSFELSDKLSFDVTDEKNKARSIHMLKEHIYTPDWAIIWTEKANNIFTWMKAETVLMNRSRPLFPFFCTWSRETLVDVKGASNGLRNNSSAITFPLNQKWVWQKYERYVQKVPITMDDKGLFAKTFTPQAVIELEVYKRDYIRNGKLIGKAGASKIKYEVKTLAEYEREMK